MTNRKFALISVYESGGRTFEFDPPVVAMLDCEREDNLVDVRWISQQPPDAPDTDGWITTMYDNNHHGDCIKWVDQDSLSDDEWAKIVALILIGEISHG